VIEHGGEVNAIRRVRERLARNEVVSIQDSGSGKTIELPFLAGYRSFHVGAPSIALASGAALLPLFTVREGGDGFLVDIGPPIEVPAAARRAQAVEMMTREFARQLAEHVRVHPECWHWGRWSPARTSAVASSPAETDGADGV
jgi:lauroyl/myristoyl acyltransferase